MLCMCVVLVLVLFQLYLAGISSFLRQLMRFLQHVLLLLTVLFAKRRKEGKKEGRRRGREGDRKGKKEMPSDTDPLGWPGISIQWLQSVNAFCFKRVDVHNTCPNSVCTLESFLVESTHVGIGLESQ